jgi:hypothetical protein
MRVVIRFVLELQNTGLSLNYRIRWIAPEYVLSSAKNPDEPHPAPTVRPFLPQNPAPFSLQKNFASHPSKTPTNPLVKTLDVRKSP